MMVVIRYLVKGSGSFCLPDNAALIHKKETEKSESIASSVLIVPAVVCDCGTPVLDIWNTVTKPNYPVKKNLPASIGLSMARRKIYIRYKVKIKHLRNIQSSKNCFVCEYCCTSLKITMNTKNNFRKDFFRICMNFIKSGNSGSLLWSSSIINE